MFAEQFPLSGKFLDLGVSSYFSVFSLNFKVPSLEKPSQTSQSKRLLFYFLQICYFPIALYSLFWSHPSRLEVPRGQGFTSVWSLLCP